MPPEARNAHRFSLFNAVNFQITLGAPMIIYAKSLGASATTIGIVASLAPLLTVLQLPTAYFIPKVGYKRFVLFGWISRTLMVFSLALLPLLEFLDQSTRISLMLLCLFVFNVLRGVSTGAWLPWLTALVPEQRRSQFLRSDQSYMQFGGVLAMAISAAVLWTNVRGWQYAAVFFLSACAGTLSLYYIRKVPDIEITMEARSSGQPVPWAAILKYPPFTRLVIFNVVCNLVIGGLGAFSILLLQGREGYSDGQILAVATLAFIGAFASVPFFGWVLERTGSKPILRVALALYLFVVILWCALAARLFPAHWLLVSGIYLLAGIAGGLFSIANTRIAMDTMPIMGRNHFFSLFTVFTSLSLGSAPIIWGIFLDAIGHLQAVTLDLEINRFSLYFALLIIVTFITMVLANPLVEKKGQPLELAVRDAVILARLRLYSRFLNR
jgi:MFS family permease